MPDYVPLQIICPPRCTFNPDRIGEANAHALMLVRASGAGKLVFTRRASELLGRPIPTTNAQRHFGHYRPTSEPIEEKLDPNKRVGDLEILDLVIQRGAANSANWKPSIKDTMEAMKLKMQMTGNSVFDDLMKLFDSDDVDAVLEEDDAAVLAAGERPDPEDLLGEPLI